MLPWAPATQPSLCTATSPSSCAPLEMYPTWASGSKWLSRLVSCLTPQHDCDPTRQDKCRPTDPHGNESVCKCHLYPEQGTQKVPNRHGGQENARHVGHGLRHEDSFLNVAV